MAHESELECSATCEKSSKRVSLEPFLQEQSSLTTFLVRWTKPVSWGLAGLLLLSIGYSYYYFQNSRQRQSDFMRAAIACQSLTQSGLCDEQSLQTLKSAVEGHPVLHEKYDGLIAQLLMARQKGDEVQGYIEQSLKHHPEIAHSLYGKFVHNSVAIAQGQYSLAVTAALQLHEALISQGFDHPSGPYARLYLANMLRLASLYCELGDAQQEKIFWKNVEEYLAHGEQKPSKAESYLKVFEIGKLSLRDYIRDRQAHLQ
jgi:hypothetical protein